METTSGPELQVLDGPAAGRKLELDRPIVVGRDPAVELSLADEEVSRRHARVRVEGSDVVIEDLGSRNGTFINDERVEGARRLRPGDRIRIGTTTLTLHLRQEQPRAAQRLAELRVIEGAAEPTAAAVRATLTLGRAPDCDVVFDDAEISRRHARVNAAATGATIEDLGSSNGTFVNGERLLGAQSLTGGDQIALGSAVIEYLEASLDLTRARPIVAPQVTSVREVLVQPSRLLTADTGSRKWWTLAVVCLASFMLLVDTTIVAVALPSIHAALGANLSALQWVVDAYAASLAAFLLTSGSLSDVIGRRNVFLAGLAVFTLFSGLCGLAWSALALDLFRGAQGVGAAMMLGPSSALIAQEFSARERGIAFGIQGGIIGLAIALGPLVGGALTDGLGWRAIFYVNLPVGAVAIAMTLHRLVNLRGEARPIDYAGLVTFSVAVFALVFGMIRGNDQGWSSAPIVASFVCAVLLLAAFVAIELRTEHPMMDLRLFRVPTFVGASAAAFCISASVMSTLIYITLWFQSVLGASPLGAGVRLLAMTVPILLLAPVSGRLSSRVPARIMLFIGVGLISTGSFVMSSVGTGSDWTVLIPGLAVAGAGLAISAPALSNTAVSIVPPWRTGMASGVNYTWRQLGLATGIAGLGAVFARQVTTHTSNLLGHSALAADASKLGRVIAAGGARGVEHGLPASLRPAVQHAAADGIAAGLSHVFVIAGVIAAAGALASLILVRPRDVVVAEAHRAEANRGNRLATEPVGG